MIRRRTIIGLSLMCALLLCAVAAQGASAAGQTIFECSKEASTENKNFSDAHCDNEVTHGTGVYGHVLFPGTPTSKTPITLTNAATRENTTKETIGVLKIATLHGFSNVVVECSEIHGTGTADNTETGGIMEATGEGTITFSNASGANCSTNQTGCTAKVASVAAKAHSVTLAAAEMGLKFEPSSGTKFTTVTFEGSCGLKAFGAIPVEGSTIATANGEPNGHGATAWFVEGTMNSLTVGGSGAQLVGKATLKRKSTGNALVLTTG